MLSELAEDGKVKKKDVDDKLAEIRNKITSPTIEALKKMLEVWSTIAKKKDYTLYINQHHLCAEAYTDNMTVSRASVLNAVKVHQMKAPIPKAYEEDVPVLEKVSELMEKISEYTSLIKGLNDALDKKCREQYEKLTDEEIIDLLVNKKWFHKIYDGIDGLYTALSHNLTARIITLVERYEKTLPQLSADVEDLETKVKSHLERMGFTW